MINSYAFSYLVNKIVISAAEKKTIPPWADQSQAVSGSKIPPWLDESPGVHGQTSKLYQGFLSQSFKFNNTCLFSVFFTVILL